MVGILGRAAHDCLLQWNGTEPSVGGSSYMALELCWPETWTAILSGGGEAEGEREVRREREG